MADFEAGRIGSHTVGSYEDDRTWRVEFRFRVAVPTLTTPVGITESIPGQEPYYDYGMSEPYEPADSNQWRNAYREFVVQENSVATMEVLKELVEMDNRYPEDLSLEDMMSGARQE